MLLVQKKVQQRNDNNNETITCGMFYCRINAGFSVYEFNKLSCNLTGQSFEIGNKNIPPTVMYKRKKTHLNDLKRAINEN